MNNASPQPSTSAASSGDTTPCCLPKSDDCPPSCDQVEQMGLQTPKFRDNFSQTSKSSSSSDASSTTPLSSIIDSDSSSDTDSDSSSDDESMDAQTTRDKNKTMKRGEEHPENESEAGQKKKRKTHRFKRIIQTMSTTDDSGDNITSQEDDDSMSDSSNDLTTSSDDSTSDNDYTSVEPSPPCSPVETKIQATFGQKRKIDIIDLTLSEDNDEIDRKNARTSTPEARPNTPGKKIRFSRK